MDPSTFTALALACAPLVASSTTHALVAVESSFNPYAIGVVSGVLERQPSNLTEALKTAERLQASGWNFSVGLAQINVGNFTRLGLTLVSAFEPCENLRAMQTVLTECFDRSLSRAPAQLALRQALSCYYSGDAATGFPHGYVQRVVRSVPPGAVTSGVPP